MTTKTANTKHLTQTSLFEDICNESPIVNEDKNKQPKQDNTKPTKTDSTKETIQYISLIYHNHGYLDGLNLPDSLIAHRQKETIAKSAYFSNVLDGYQIPIEDALLSLKTNQEVFSSEVMQLISNYIKAWSLLKRTKPKELNIDLIQDLNKTLRENLQSNQTSITTNTRQSTTVLESLSDFLKDIQKNNEDPIIQSAAIYWFFHTTNPFNKTSNILGSLLSNYYLEIKGFRFCQLFAISESFLNQKKKYQEILHSSKQNEEDIPFINFYLKNIAQQLINLKHDILKLNRQDSLRSMIDPKIYKVLNKRHLKTLKKVIFDEEDFLNTKTYCKTNRCSDETARKDFNEMLALKLIEAVGEGRGRKYKLRINS